MTKVTQKVAMSVVVHVRSELGVGAISAGEQGARAVM